MKFKLHNMCHSQFLVVSLLTAILILFSTAALPQISDNQQPIYIDSTKQQIDVVTNTITLTGNVIIKRGSINIRAEKVIITRYNGKSGNEVLEGFGNPVTFYQLQEDGNPIRGHSQKVRYETANDLVLLIGNAYVERFDSNIKGDRINYLIKKQKIEAFSSKGNQVTTVLIPKELHNKHYTNS